MIESLSLSMFYGLFDSEWLFFSCAVGLHGVCHWLLLLGFKAILHEFEVILATDWLADEHTNV